MICPVFLPHLGCTKRCTYCHQTYITQIDGDDIKTTIKKMLPKKGAEYEVGLYGGNIFGIEPGFLKKIFASFEEYKDKILNFRISTKPVPLNDEIITILKENNVTVIELGIPSFNNRILQKINRDHTSNDLIMAYKRLKSEGFFVALQVMVGLPDETKQDIMDMVEHILLLKPDYIRIYPLAIIMGTPLWQDYEIGRFVPISFEEAVLRALYIYLEASINKIKVAKMGLTDNDIIKEKIVGGFYHPAFGSIVKSEGFFLAIHTKLEDEKIKGHIKIYVHKRDIPDIIGYKRSNVERLKNQGIILEIQERQINQGNFVIDYKDKEFNCHIFYALKGLNKKGFVTKLPERYDLG